MRVQAVKGANLFRADSGHKVPIYPQTGNKSKYFSPLPIPEGMPSGKGTADEIKVLRTNHIWSTDLIEYASPAD
jgi:hypothetical protein